MHKKIVPLVLVLALVLAGTGSVWAADAMTRGQFAQLMVEVSGLEGELPAADLLQEKGIMIGYPDGEMYLQQGITRVEAVTLAAKALGLADGIAPPATVIVPLPKDHWGYNYYGWLLRQGLVDGNPTDVFTVAEGEAFLRKIFSTDPEAVEILEEAQLKAKEHKKMRIVMNGRMEMVAREGVAGAEEIPQIKTDMRLIQTSIFPDLIHQQNTMLMEVPGEEPLEITAEAYIVDGKMFQQMPDPETGEMQWFRYPDIPGLEDVLKQSAEQQTEVIPAEMEEYLHYHLLDTIEIDGEEVYVISFCGRIDDFNQFMEAAFAQFGEGMQMQQALAPAAEMIKSMSYWGIQYIGAEDLLVRSADFSSIVVYADEILGEPMPIEAARMSMEIEEYDYDENIVIEVPDEVLAAPELDLAAPNRESEPELPQ
ncbi:MAG: DUF6612 family protein [bacterium]|jgi:hypothetical protein